MNRQELEAELGALLKGAPHGRKLHCKGWVQEAALRMLLNNLDPVVAEDSERLIVYGGLVMYGQMTAGSWIYIGTQGIFETLAELARQRRPHPAAARDPLYRLELFPDDEGLRRWLTQAQDTIACQGLPARIWWVGYGERHRAGLRFNALVRDGIVKAPLVIGRDHLDSGSVASPNRETEDMLDGSDAVADWPILNALANAIGGASWVSVHGGGGVGIGYSEHAGVVIVADGTEAADRRLERVLTSDPALGVMRHADAGYERARDRGVEIPHLD